MSLTRLQVILLMLLTAQVTDKSSYLHIDLHCNSKYCRCFSINSLFGWFFTIHMYHCAQHCFILVSPHICSCFPGLGLNRRAHPKTEPNHVPLSIEVFLSSYPLFVFS